MPYSESEILLLDHSCILEADTFFLGLGSAPTITAGTLWTQITFFCIFTVYLMSPSQPREPCRTCNSNCFQIAPSTSFFSLLSSRKQRYTNFTSKPPALSWLQPSQALEEKPEGSLCMNVRPLPLTPS